MITSRTHVRLTSSASQGHGGIDIWLLRVSSTGKVLFDPKKIQVYLAQPEILMLSVDYHETRFLIISAHVPHTERPESDHATFWNLLRTQVRKYQGQCSNIILGLDANTHFATDQLPHLGALGLETHANRAGEFFLETLEECQLFLPTTFDQYYEGDTMTWTNPTNGTRSRCDYIALPLAWRNATIHGYLLPSINAGRQGKDHFPIALDVTVFLSTKARVRNDIAFDRMQLQKATPEQLQQAFDILPEVPWNTDVDVHAKVVSEWVQGQLAKHFPRQGTSQRNNYISKET